jgi:Domain of unknown function (DUF4114)/Vanadium chloroperoxidase N-terminal domain
MQNLTGTAGTADNFVITQKGSTITGFNYAEGDRIILDVENSAERATSSETLTNFDIINPLIGQAATAGVTGYDTPLKATATGVEVRIPAASGIGGELFVTINTADQAAATSLITTLSNSPAPSTSNGSAFQVRSKGNTIVDWDDVVVDAARMAGVPPAASTRYFALTHTAMYDAVQGILKTAGRQGYLESQGINLPPAAAGANADVAAAAAARTILTSLFTDPNNPVAFNQTTGAAVAFTPTGGTATTIKDYYPGVFRTQLDNTIIQSRESGATQAAINAGLAYGDLVAKNFLASRQTDGYLLDEKGARRNIATISAEYKDGIEALGKDEAGGENNGTVGILSNGTKLIGAGAPISTIQSTGTAGITGTAATTPGAWRRAEDTLGINGQFAALASPEVASINQTWFLPSPSFFLDTIGSPPALDSQRYIDSVAEVKAEGSILDLPGTGDVTLTNRSTTANGVTTSIAGPTVLGARVNDTSAVDNAYPNAVGADAPLNLPRSQPDGIGATSADRTTIAHVWANAEGSYGPNYAYQKIAQQLAINNNDSLADSAYRFAVLDTALADGFANLWDAKWDEDYFWRPVSSVRNADQLAGTASLDDNTWTPRENTPQHPCHPSGTSATAGIASTLLASFYGENPVGGFTVSADVNRNSARLAGALTDTNADGRTDVNGVALEEVSRNYTSFSQVREETRLSRIYAGAHFRFATERGVQLGTNVANYLLANNPFLKSNITGLAADPVTGVFRAGNAVDAVAQARWLKSGSSNYEFGFITVDNASGSIDGLTTDNAAYLATALNRKHTLFDGKSNASTQAITSSNLAGSEAQSAGQLANADLLGNTIFYLTENGVTTLSNTGGSKFSSTSAAGLNQLTFKDSANQDVRFEVGAALPAFRTNGTAGGANTNVTVSIARAAAFNNSVGIYAVDDAQGCFDTNADGLVDLRVGQTGYLAEALRRAALNPALTQAATNGTTASSTVSLAAGQSFGLLLVSNGTLAAASAAGSTLNVFSSYTGANTDGLNHIVRLGNGTTEVFGFEDQLGGGDRDFNDLIVNITKTPTPAAP